MPKGVTLLTIVVAVLVLAAPAAAAAPNYILVSGRGLVHPVLLADWQQNLRILLATGNAPRVGPPIAARLRRRPRFDLAEYWAWGGRPRPTSPAEASQHGVFYPAHAGQPAVILLQVDGLYVPRLASPFVLKVFARKGVPTRL